MKTWCIEPRDPLIARDGRPSDVGRFSSLPFPLPSTLAGAVRTRMASVEGAFELLPQEALQLRSLAVSGPLLLELDAPNSPSPYFAPAPLDVSYEAEASGSLRRHRLAPMSLGRGEGVDGLSAHGLAPIDRVRPRTTNLKKPPHGLPAFWSWSLFERWLIDPLDESIVQPKAEALPALSRERRVHVSIEPGERVGVEGALFESEGLRFLVGPDCGKLDRLAPRRFALGFAAEEDPAGTLLGQPLALRPELAPLGGERRLARWREAPAAWPAPPPGLREAIVSSRRARLVLLTPADFTAGALPGWNHGTVPGTRDVSVRVAAACVPRAVVVSGWDLAIDNGANKKPGRPKPTRRLAAAGSVFFLELDGDAAALGAWFDALWLRPVSDEPQARRDGFGLAALGVWPKEEA